MKKLSLSAIVLGAVCITLGFTCREPVTGLLAGLLGADRTDFWIREVYAERTLFVLLLFGFLTLLWGTVGVLFDRWIVQRCAIRTTAVGMGVSAATGLGVCCLVSFSSCFFLTNPSRHPIRLPLSLLVGLLCLVAVCVLFYLYRTFRRQKRAIDGIVLDVVFGLSYVPAYYMISLLISDIVATMI